MSRALKPEAVLEQFTMVAAEPTDAGADVWRCVFEHRGREINFDRQSVSLLRRIAPIARWTRVERAVLEPTHRAEYALDGAWRDFGRRRLP